MRNAPGSRPSGTARPGARIPSMTGHTRAAPPGQHSRTPPRRPAGDAEGLLLVWAPAATTERDSSVGRVGVDRLPDLTAPGSYGWPTRWCSPIRPRTVVIMESGFTELVAGVGWACGTGSGLLGVLPIAAGPRHTDHGPVGRGRPSGPFSRRAAGCCWAPRCVWVGDACGGIRGSPLRAVVRVP